MITITGPKFIGLSKNPLPVTLQSTDYLASAGSVASAVISFGSVVLGDSINIIWSAGNITFTMATTPDDSGEQLPFGTVSVAYVTTLIPWLNRNFYLNRDYIISQAVDGGGALLPAILLTAKAVGINYNITQVTTGNITLAATNGANKTIKTGFGHLLQVWIKGSASDSLVYESTLGLDYPYTGASSKDLSDTLNTQLDFDIPDIGQFWQPCSKSFAEYYLKYAQVTGDTPKVQRLFQSPDAFVYLGGYSELALNGVTDPDFFQKTLIPNPALYQFQRWFETFPVDNFVLRTNMPQLLYFVNNRTMAETLNVKIDIVFDLAPPQTIIKSGGLVQPQNKVCINCSYLGLGLDAYTGGGVYVVGYTLTLIEATSGQARSLPKTFTIDRSYAPYVRYILYSDSAGNFKTLQLNGTSQATAEVSDGTSEKFTDQDTPFLGNISRYNVLSTKSDAINTGYIDADLYDQIEELLMAKKAFRVFQNALVPIIIKTQKFELSSDRNNLNGIKIEYQLAYRETVFTASTGNLVVPELNKPQTPLNI